MSNNNKSPGLRGVILVLPIVIALAIGIWWMIGGRAPDTEPSPVVLLVSGDTNGWITPCGCASNQSGGLLRRGSHVESLQSEARVIYADVGGTPGGASEYEKTKFEAILRGEVEMGVVAHNLGEREARLGADFLRKAAEGTGAPFVSANLRDRDGKHITEPVRAVEFDGQRFLLTGVLSTRYREEGLRIDSPKQAVLSVLAEAQPYDSLIVLAYLPEEELQAFAADLPEADVIVGGPTGQTIPPRRVGPVLLTSATNKGKFLAQLSFDKLAGSRRPSWRGEVVEMAKNLDDSPIQLANLERYHQALADLDFTAKQSGFAAPLPDGIPEEYAIAGSASCRECHENDCALWDHSKHALAWTTLETRGYHVDSYCQQCHTTGFGMQGGFVSARRSPERTAVGCENCHGPSLAHVRNPATRTPYRAADQCVRCHDQENSPNFDYASYWEKILHGDASASALNETARLFAESESLP